LTESPISSLSSSVGKTVTVRTQDGLEATGKLDSVDEYMNLSLTDAEIRMEGAQPRKVKVTNVKGENLVFISLSP